MGLFLKSLVLSMALTTGSFVMAAEPEAYSEDFYEISKVEIQEVTPDPFGFSRSETVYSENLKSAKFNNPVENVGRVIAIGKEVVALGESVYQLVIKGKPRTRRYF
jgi:hypothetical protein